jgi:RNA polymerase sigma factor (sigma-70 family)
MTGDNLEQHLSRIQTLWTLVRKAHAGTPGAVRDAQQQLLDRYGGAIRRYLRGVLHNADAADDLFQDFACRLLKGGLHGADPERGRFRNYVKGVLFHLVADHHRQVKRRPAALGDDVPEPAVGPPSLAELDRDFVQSWRDEVLARSWQLLEAEPQNGKMFYTVLRFRAEHPALSSQQLAEKLSVQLGKPLTAASVRQTLHRARERFSDLLLDEVLHALENPTAEMLEQELIELGLIDYCRPALEKRQGK